MGRAHTDRFFKSAQGPVTYFIGADPSHEMRIAIVSDARAFVVMIGAAHSPLAMMRVTPEPKSISWLTFCKPLTFCRNAIRSEICREALLISASSRPKLRVRLARKNTPRDYRFLDTSTVQVVGKLPNRRRECGGLGRITCIDYPNSIAT